ncbi:hypothetical protein JTE90_024691 [Oedothorax gibbosus]|uniref:Uncharacterized protein n=1 Tax=Oedothorax gibbosus TaxID=931172 RepID=A0AAV6UBE2_9ARAC|nr:hypothetical protein JTE90_024691 [Oedothorax gibbosus]
MPILQITKLSTSSQKMIPILLRAEIPETKIVRFHRENPQHRTTTPTRRSATPTRRAATSSRQKNRLQPETSFIVQALFSNQQTDTSTWIFDTAANNATYFRSPVDTNTHQEQSDVDDIEADNFPDLQGNDVFNSEEEDEDFGEEEKVLYPCILDHQSQLLKVSYCYWFSF